MEKEQIKNIISNLEQVSIIIDRVEDFNKLQEDYIDFSIYEDNKDGGKDLRDSALLTLNELLRTKESHLSLCYQMTDLLKDANDTLEKSLRKLYKEIKEDKEEEALKDE